MDQLRRVVMEYVPNCEQEERDKALMLGFLDANADCLTRDNLIAHFTASSWIVNPSGNKVLMVYHRIYDSWSWTGGHADGEADLLAVAVREAKEETGISSITVAADKPVSLEVITVDGHIKKDVYVSSHLHLNLTYLLVADEEQKLSVKEDENTDVQWIPLEELSSWVSEPWMLKWVYQKLINQK